MAAVINTKAKPGDIIAFCPDQLGPAVYRVGGATRRSYTMVTFPRGTGPQFVDWVDYAERRPCRPTPSLRRQAGGRGRDAPTASGWSGSRGTRPTAIKCEQIATALLLQPDSAGTTG